VHRPSKARHRFHTDRIVRVRRARYRNETSWTATKELAYGRLAKTDPWDCGHAACGLCHPRDFGRRAREAQLWRKDWEV
jgi:hypothetical protein